MFKINLFSSINRESLLKIIKEFRNKLDKFFRVYWWPLIFTIAAFEIGVGIFSFYFFPTSKPDSGTLIEVEALITVLATFTGIFVPLQITRNLKKEDDRRILAFSLGMIWTELRKNEFVLEQIEVNYRFRELFVLPNFDDLIKMLLGKYKFVHIAVNELHDKSFVASQNSGAITTFDKDDVFNDVTQAYENLTNFRLASLLTLETLKMKEYLIRNSPDPITTAEKSMFVEEIKVCLINAYRQLLFCQRMMNKAITSVDTRLNEMAVVSTKEIRDLESIEEVP